MVGGSLMAPRRMRDESIGPRIKQLRKAAGLSQGALSGEGVSASYISLIESGRRQPTRNALALIALRLDMSVRDLLDGTAVGREEVARFLLPFPLDAIDDLRQGMQRAYGMDVMLHEDNGWLIALRMK